MSLRHVHDLPEAGFKVRRPATVLAWLRAYAAATATTTSWDKIRDAATSGTDDKPAKTTAQPYVELLTALRILDPLPAWIHLRSALSPNAEGEPNAQFEKWMAKNCLTLGELDRERIADIDRRLSLKLDGSPLAATTANRIRIVARASVQSAIDAGAIAADAWPQRSKTRARRKVARTKRSVDVGALPGPAAMAEAIDAIVTQQPGSKTYRVMTAVAYYAGLRPSEVVMLRVRSTQLPAEGWGRLEVTEADISFDEPGRTRRTQDRTAQCADPTGPCRDAARMGPREQPDIT